MRRFSIKDLERFSGIKAHTIRTWENRYTIFAPQRSATNIRSYSLADVKLLLDISLLIENGLRISQIATLDPAEIELRTNSLLTDEAKQRKVIYKLIVCMFNSDIESFELILDSCNLSLGINYTIENYIIPFLEKVQLLSYRDTTTEIHFAVTAVRKKIILGIESREASHRPETALLFLPKGEHYDLLLLYMTYILKGKGLRILYLGTDISMENLKKITRDKKPDYLYTYLTSRSSLNIEELATFLVDELLNSKLFIIEPETSLSNLDTPNVEFFHYHDVSSSIAQQPMNMMLDPKNIIPG